MSRQARVCVVLCLAVSALIRAAAAAEPQVEYYRAGDVGAFAATIALPPDVNIGTVELSALPADDKVYLLYVDLPVSMMERLEAAHRHHQPRLNPEQQAKANALDKENGEVWKQISASYDTTYKNRQKVEGLKVLLKEEEARKENRDDAAIARTKQALERVEAETTRLEGEQQKLYTRSNELETERRKLYAAAREGFREAARSLPIRVLGRFQGAGKTRVTVLGHASETLLAAARPIATVDLDLPAADGGNADVLKQWALAQAADFAFRAADSPFSSYYQYCLLQSVRKYGVPDNAIPPSLRARDDRRRPDLYSMTTGALAIQESLQLDTMTGREKIPDDRTVALDSLKGPAIKSHPFDKMLQGRAPKTFPAAALVPYDAYYCHFSSMSKEIATSDLLKQWGADLLRMLEVNARDSDVPSKYHEQLCIGVSLLTRLFGDLVIGEVAITGNDPFLREGTDLTVLIQVKNRARFDKQMKGYVDAALAAHHNAAVGEATHEGVAIRSITTPDLRLSSHSATLGDYAVYSNSLDALKRVIDTQAKRRPSMADNLDFQYMRTIFPGTPADEDGFIYLSDAFIRKLVGPRWKIEAQRRIVCQNHLRMIGNAATMFSTELRKSPTVEDLLKENYLPAEALKCPDGGTYSLDPSSGVAVCSVHNRLRYCTPADSVAVAKASDEEAQDYRRFVENYNTYWRQYFDPIGIRFKVGDRIEVETCILPLIESSAYNQLREIVGGKPVRLDARVLTPRTIFSAALKLDLTQPNYREMVEGMQRSLFPTLPPVTDAVGSSMAIGLCDSDVLFTVDERGMGEFGGWMNLEEQLVLATILSSLNLPIYGVVELKDEALARTIVRDLLRLGAASSRFEERRPWEDFFGIDHYASGEHNGHAVGTMTLRLAVIRFRLYHAIAHKRLLVATKRYVLEDLLDALDKGAAAEEAVGNVRVDVCPRAYDKLLPVTTTGWMELMREACLRNLVPVQALFECHGATEESLDEVSRRVEGVTPRCPAGGTYKFDPLRGVVYCTVHGDRAHPSQPVAPSGKEDLVRFLRRVRDFSIDFRFTDEGIMTKAAFNLDPVKE